MELIDISRMTKKEWLKLRRASIGGSEISILFSMNPYQNAKDLWRDKTGRGQDKDNPAMARGKALEPIAADFFAEKYKMDVRETPYLYRKKNGYIHASPDRIIYVDDEPYAILEIKCPGVNSYRSMQERGMPLMYQMQVQMYMHITGIHKAFIAAFSAEHWDCIQEEFTYNPEVGENIELAAKDFFERYVLTDTAPEKFASKYKAPKEAEVDRVLAIDQDLAVAIEGYIAATAKLSGAKVEKDAYKERIETMMCGYKHAKNKDYAVSISEINGRSIFDRKKFEADFSDVDLSEYMKETEPFTRINIKQGGKSGSKN